MDFSTIMLQSVLRFYLKYWYQCLNKNVVIEMIFFSVLVVCDLFEI